MRPIGETARKLSIRQWHWCRRGNGFSDMPVWRLVARNCNLPLVTVLAFVNRLEELANNAGNFGRERGSVETFDAGGRASTGYVARLFGIRRCQSSAPCAKWKRCGVYRDRRSPRLHFGSVNLAAL